MSSRTQVAVIGYGFSGKCFHSYLIGLVPELELRGIASRNASTRERIKAERRCRAYENFDAVLGDPAVDLVVLATPNNTHADLAVAAMQAGKHVITDKVMCLSLADCDRMIAMSRETDRFLSVFQNRRWDGDYLTLRQCMANGDLGDVRWIEMAWQGFGAWGGWRGQAAMGGGRFFDLGAHLIDQLVMLFPQPIETVYCRMHHDNLPDSDVESHAQVTVTFAGGRTGICDMSSTAAISKPRFYACGTSGTFEKYGVDPQEAAMIAEDIDSAVEPETHYARLGNGKEEHRIPTLPGRWRSYYEAVADVLQNGAEPAVKLGEVRRAIAVLDAAKRSAAANQVIRLEQP